MNQPPPELYGTVLDALTGTDPWRHSAAAAMSRLVKHLALEEAECLPSAFVGVLPLLRGDLDRLRFASELAVRFDFFETAGSVLELAIETHDPGLMLDAADLVANPAADASVRQQVMDSSVGNAEQRRAIQIRANPAVVPATSDEQRLYQLSWPGSRAGRTRSSLPPAVVIDADFRADRALRFVAKLIGAGATVRRLDAASALPPWFGSETGLVCRQRTRNRVRDRFREFPDSQIVVPDDDDLSDDQWDQARLLQRLRTVLPGMLRLDTSGGAPDLMESLWAPEVFTAGVYSTREAAFLAGAKASSLNGLRRRELLRPRDSGVLRWNFRDVVAVRTWTYLRSLSPKPVSAKVVHALAQFEGDRDAVRIGVTTGGSVMVDHGQGFEDVLTGQGTLDLPVRDVDAAFRPFEFGGGSTPDLIHASANSSLHPACLHGTPHLSGHRISAKDLASLDQAGGRATILDAYPELETVAYGDVVDVGHQLLALR